MKEYFLYNLKFCTTCASEIFVSAVVGRSSGSFHVALVQKWKMRSPMRIRTRVAMQLLSRMCAALPLTMSLMMRDASFQRFSIFQSQSRLHSRLYDMHII